MIIVNGYIRPLINNCELDPVTGYPTETMTDCGEPISCQYVLRKEDRTAMESNRVPYTSKSYYIYLESMPVNFKRVALYSKRNEHIGDFAIVSVEELDTVRQVRLTV